MADKKFTLAIGGKELVLNIGANYFYEFFEQATGIDLFKEGMVDVGSIKFIKYVKGIIYAGHHAECGVNKLTPEFTKEEIDHLVMCMNEDEITDIFIQYSSVRSGKTIEELKNVVAQASNGVKQG